MEGTAGRIGDLGGSDPAHGP